MFTIQIAGPSSKLKCGSLHCKQTSQVILMHTRVFRLLLNQISWRLDLFVGLETSLCSWSSAGLGRQGCAGQCGNSRGLVWAGISPGKCVPGGRNLWLCFRGGGLLCLGPWVGFTFWGTPAQFKDVENHLSLPSSSLGWRLVLRPVFTAVSPWP